MECGVCTGN